MSADAADPDDATPLSISQSFDLESRFDDSANPTTVTITPAAPDDPTTEWLTIDAGVAVPIEETV